MIKILISVGFGYLLSVVQKKRESRKNIRNIKTILFKELSVNYDNINKVLPKDNKFHPAFFDLPVQVCRSLRLAVYENYLGRLAELPKHELEEILDAYQRLNEIRKEAETLDKDGQSQQKEPQEVFQLRINIFLQNVFTFRQKIETALRAFKDGDQFLIEASQHRGIEYEKLFEAVSHTVGKQVKHQGST